MIKKRKVVIVGAGNVGASTAFCMINQGICDEIVLIDMNTERAKGETLDMIHSIAFMNRNMEMITKSSEFVNWEIIQTAKMQMFWLLPQVLQWVRKTIV
jgi:malate/lactate dehydrogenase